MDAIICRDYNGDKGQEEYQVLDIQIWNWVKNNYKPVQGSHWADPVIHPVTSSPYDGYYAIPIKLDYMQNALTPSQLARIEELTADWFPPLPEF